MTWNGQHLRTKGGAMHNNPYRLYRSIETKRKTNDDSRKGGRCELPSRVGAGLIIEVNINTRFGW